jgi:hypothetical protein
MYIVKTQFTFVMDRTFELGFCITQMYFPFDFADRRLKML